MNHIQRKGAIEQSRIESSALPVALAPLGLLAITILILLLATFLRFHNLGTQSLWNDEGSSYVQATRSAVDIAYNAARDIHPPGYYWLLAFWQRSTGDSEFALRAFSAFASILSVAAAYALGKRLFNPVAGLGAAVFVALNTFSIYYAQEARMYALLALWGAAGMWALAGVLKLGSIQKKQGILPNRGTSGITREMHEWGLWLGFINAAGLYTQYAYPFIMIAQALIVVVWLAASYRQNRFMTALRSPVVNIFLQASLIAVLIFLPWLPTAVRQVTSWPNTGQPIPAREALATITGWFTFGVSYKDAAGAADIIPVALILLVIGIAVRLYRCKGRSGWRLVMPLLWVGVPMVLFLALGMFRTANLKLLLPAQIGFAVLMGGGIAGWWSFQWKASRLFAVLLTMGILAFGYGRLDALYNSPQYQRSDYRDMVAMITANPRPGDAIILDAPNQAEVFRYYYHGDAPIFALPPGLGGNDAETLAAVTDVIAHYDRIFVLFWGEDERDPKHIVESTLDTETFQAGEDRWYGDVRFAVYAPPARMPTPTILNARFGDHITLVNDALNATTFHPGDVLQTVFTWQTDAPLSNESAYKVFLQLLNKDGVLVAQRDTEPASGSRPTQSWKVGETIVDRQGLTIPSDLPPGDYQLIVGLYDANNPSARLSAGGGGYLTLATIHVQ